MDTQIIKGRYYNIQSKTNHNIEWMIWADTFEIAESIAEKMDKSEIVKMTTERNTKEYEQIKGQDNVKSPSYYISDKGFEVFDVQEAYIHDLKGMAASFWCNVVKYILRFQMKNGVEDLKKAKYYLEKLIEEQEEEE